MGIFEVSHGTVNTTVCQPREVFQKLLALNAVSFILVHNHPSGDPEPSQLDVAMTQRMQQCGDLLGIGMLDHIIVANYGGTYSFNESGVI